MNTRRLGIGRSFAVADVEPAAGLVEDACGLAMRGRSGPPSGPSPPHTVVLGLLQSPSRDAELRGDLLQALVQRPQRASLQESGRQQVHVDPA